MYIKYRSTFMNLMSFSKYLDYFWSLIIHDDAYISKKTKIPPYEQF